MSFNTGYSGNIIINSISDPNTYFGIICIGTGGNTGLYKVYKSNSSYQPSEWYNYYYNGGGGGGIYSNNINIVVGNKYNINVSDNATFGEIIAYKGNDGSTTNSSNGGVGGYTNVGGIGSYHGNNGGGAEGGSVESGTRNGQDSEIISLKINYLDNKLIYCGGGGGGSKDIPYVTDMNGKIIQNRELFYANGGQGYGGKIFDTLKTSGITNYNGYQSSNGGLYGGGSGNYGNPNTRSGGGSVIYFWWRA